MGRVGTTIYVEGKKQICKRITHSVTWTHSSFIKCFQYIIDLDSWTLWLIRILYYKDVSNILYIWTHGLMDSWTHLKILNFIKTQLGLVQIYLWTYSGDLLSPSFLAVLSVVGFDLPQLKVHLADLLVLLGLPLADGGGRLRPGTITGCSWGSRAVSW